MAVCGACAGTGQIPCGACGATGYTAQSCPNCGGTGADPDIPGSPLEPPSPIALAVFQQDGTVQYGYCPQCGGAGRQSVVCATCGGTG
jgi:hypothetical protein